MHKQNTIKKNKNKTPNFYLLPITQDTNILLCKYHEPLHPVNQLYNMSSYMVD